MVRRDCFSSLSLVRLEGPRLRPGIWGLCFFWLVCEWTKATSILVSSPVLAATKPRWCDVMVGHQKLLNRWLLAVFCHGFTFSYFVLVLISLLHYSPREGRD